MFLSETVFDNLMMAYAIAEERGFGLLRAIDQSERMARVDSHLQRYLN